MPASIAVRQSDDEDCLERTHCRKVIDTLQFRAHLAGGFIPGGADQARQGAPAAHHRDAEALHHAHAGGLGTLYLPRTVTALLFFAPRLPGSRVLMLNTGGFIQ